MLGSPFLPIQSVQFVLLCLVPLAAAATARKKVLPLICIYFVAAWFLVFKISEYAGSGRLPMDISALCYFLYGFSAFLPVRPVKVAVAQLCSLCGLIYAICMLTGPQIFYERDPSEIGRYFAVANHALLLFGGLVMMMHVRFRLTDLFYTAGILGGIVAYTEICVAKGVAEGTAVFSQIVNGSVIRLLAPSFSMPWWYYLLYYPILFGLLGLWLYFTYAINRRAVPKTKSCGFFAV